MHALVIYCHPNPASFTAAVRDVVLEKLAAAGASTTLIDLYAEGFDPILTAPELVSYPGGPTPECPFADHIARLRAADTLIFVYPTWWYGLPALLKGWLDRVLLPDVAFILPPDGPITPGLTHITRFAAFTTCGASWWLTRFVGAPGRRTLMRGVRILCAKRARTGFTAHYKMDASTPASRARHLTRVAAQMDRLLRGQGAGVRSSAPSPVQGRG